ncbi:putative transporter, MFS_1 family [Cupriavidus taiwanensis]|uniref:Transporter, MFS_1 family n=1 Tax=Cupriavidus taiwanensis TaxID=164546 RepID=A0A976AZ36_9BURK|nr:MFS transporter [Cupriavidus taiwanensis]SOZ18529.1 putative transporter, MFS_1 family [Cupriavidus taiwanensis]SOZ31660.1 putative transporter, MFS_1 family [Cupriavidus taiwanensis]SOZ47562.1 putative transporter, MFS_1 family [Cupriavidus taiwanensis]SOZ61696.1 putative transporter, MFS_1 family [Cupriavidus taiwanensis]SOZ66005.1 putative transporter, MFS_1 family [Cupriavidus taiwanensis]
MSPAPATSPAATLADPAVPGRLVLLLATGAGLAVASLYYSQPMLGVMAPDLHASDATAGAIPTLTQLGYALGILLLAPLGDRYDRRHIIVAKAVALVGALLLAGLAPGIGMLLVSSLVVGLSATLAQDIVPAAATLAPAAQRGKVVGTVMTGLLLGILLSRVVSGFVAAHFGWRAMFVLAAASIAAVALVARRQLPRFSPATTLPYRALLASLAALWRQHGALRRAALAQGLLSVGFSAFWSTLAVMLHGAPFHLGSEAAGAFGLAGAAGALGAPLAGRLADRGGPERVTRAGAALAALSFAAMLLTPLLAPQAQLWLTGASAIGFDLGVQVALVAHQTIVYGIDPGARSRLNAVLFVCMFTGMAAGAALGSLVLARFGWTGVAALATAAALCALAVRLLPKRAAQ